MHIYFSGLGGVAIGPLALIARDAGYTVSGSDLHESRWTKIMEAQGVKVAIGQDGSHIKEVHQQDPIDWMVISSAIPPDHPEVRFAESAGIKITKRAPLLNTIIEDHNLQLVAISGTHGKTTTTAMMVWLFKQFNLPVSYSIGSNINFGPSGAYQKESTYFIYECDEYDRNMLEFHPFLSLLPSVGYDHPDIYPSPQDYDAAFRHFAVQSERVMAWHNDLERLRLAHSHLHSIKNDDPHISQITLPGQHYRMNGLMAACGFQELFPDIPLDQIIAKVSTFPGTDRRFERLADNIYTTYSHHPVEIKSDLQMALELNKHIVVAYQPHQNTRQQKLQDEYRDAFNAAEKVYWLPTYLSREGKNLPVLTPEDLIGKLANPRIAEPADMNQDLAAKLKEAASGGKLVVCMGAGTIDEWARQYLVR